MYTKLFKKPTVSIIIPFFNEAKTLEDVVSGIVRLKIPGWHIEIILINDGSTDDFYEKIRRYLPHLTFIQHAKNEGMGAALTSGIQKAKGEIILFQDADCEYNPDDIPALLKPFDDNKITVVYGSRYKNKSKRGYYIYYLATYFFTSLINFLYKTNLTDAFTGYKIFRSSIIKNIHSKYNGFEFNVDITTKVLRKGLKIVEVPVAYNPRSFSEGKKISPWIGVKDFFIIIKNRFL